MDFDLNFLLSYVEKVFRECMMELIFVEFLEFEDFYIDNVVCVMELVFVVEKWE